MISLLYHSHTLVPGHLVELESLGLLDADEQVLVAIDGVLLDAAGRRLSGPTLHDYCLITNLRVLLWARDYSRHQGWAFPLSELSLAEGEGIDPLHAKLRLVFAGPEGEEEFTLTLMPSASLMAALALLETAGEAAREAGDDADEIGPAVIAALSEQIFGHADGVRPGSTPYRWDGAPPPAAFEGDPNINMMFQADPANLPPGQIYAAGRLARSAWDTFRKALREADLPFDLNNNSLRDLTEAVRAINELVHTVSANPNAQQMAMAFLNRQGQPGAAPMPPTPQAQAAPAAAPTPQTPEAPPAAPSEYREIPLRRRDAPRPAASQPAAAAPPAAPVEPPATAAPPAADPLPDRREIPLRRRTPGPRPAIAVPMSGSGDRSETEERK